MSSDALASFEAKWMQVRPELALALRFADASKRPYISAFACLSNEVDHAAFRIVEPGVAATKLHWWAEELAGLAVGRTRHPLSETLAKYSPMRELGSRGWATIIPAAFAARETGPFPSLDAMIDATSRLQIALATIEATLHQKMDVENSAMAASLSSIFDESVCLIDVLARDRLPIPLDLLARHQLSRGEISQPGPRRDAALRDHFHTLATQMRCTDKRGLSPLTAIRLQADQTRCQRAAQADDALAESARNQNRLPLSSVWTGWRAARHMRASG